MVTWVYHVFYYVSLQLFISQDQNEVFHGKTQKKRKKEKEEGKEEEKDNTEKFNFEGNFTESCSHIKFIFSGDKHNIQFIIIFD